MEREPSQKEAGETQTTFPWQPQSTAQPWGLGKLWQTCHAEPKQNKATLPFPCCPFSAENQPSPKIQGLSPDPPFCHPKADPYFCTASRELKTFGILLHQFQSQHQFSSCDESPQELEFKNEQSGRFFPHYNFFFPPGKVISQKFCWTKASPVIVNAAILIYSSQGSGLFFQQVA